MSREALDQSFDDKEVADLASVVAEFPDNDELPEINIPVKKLSEEFDNAAKPDDSMKVYLRVRPIADKADSTVIVETSNTILTSAPESSKRAQYTKTEERRYTFTRVFGPETSQEDVYETIVGPLCARFIGGESCALIAYGMTNAGKTFTIQGSTKNTGIFPRLVTAVLNKCTSLKESSLELSILEIYQEKLQDLLAQKKEKLSIRDGNGKIEVANLSSHKVNSVTDAVKYLEVAASKRTKSKTLLNAGSSRSHALYTLTLTHTVNGATMSSIFQVVDLAGSERGNRTKGTASQQKEANNINCSLMQLWRCLQGMRKKPASSSTAPAATGRTTGSLEAPSTAPGTASSAPMLPFRESKLTHLLMPQLCQSGLSGIAIITCVNPQSDDYDETITVLGNASLACKITELAEINRVPVAPNTHRNSSLVSGGDVELVAETVGKKRSMEAASAGGPPNKMLRDSMVMAGIKSITASTRPASKGSKASAGALLPSASKRGLVDKSKHLEGTAAAMLVDEECVGACDYGEGEDDRVPWNAKEVIQDLRAEIIRLRQENTALTRNQIIRETEIRSEVCEEMAKQSSVLLQQIQDLQDRLHQHELTTSEVTRSVRKAKRKQIDMENEITLRDLKEAEDEILRMKHSHEVETSGLRNRIKELEMEVNQLRVKAGLPELVIDTSVRNSAESVASENSLESMDSGCSESATLDTTAISAAAKLKQRLSRDQRFHGSKRTVIVQENGVVILQKKKPVTAPTESPSGRSPLALIRDESNCQSPIRLDALAAVAQKQQQLRTKSPMKTRSKQPHVEPVAAPTTTATNDENLPSPVNKAPDTAPTTASVTKSNASAPLQQSSNMKASKQTSVMRRLRSTFRII